jgi:uncharacterized protein with beta-barrel porin domain
MKPRFHRSLPFILPAIIVIPAMLQFSPAATILPAPSGNVTVPAGTNAADSVLASGGISPTPVVTIQAGATLTGDAVVMSTVVVSAPGYTIDNAGTLRSVAEGIFVEAAASPTVTIQLAPGSLTEGGNDGIYLDGNGGMVRNLGTIRGITGATSDGIEAFNGFMLENFGGISGANGLLAEDGLVLQNLGSGRIEGLTGAGVDAGANATVTNEAGAEIRGGFGGILLGAGGSITNAGLVDGMGGDGIRLGANGMILNSGTITGTTGIVATAGATVTSSGRISSSAIGGNAFSGGAGNDELRLNVGSIVQGNVLGGGGMDSILFNGGLTSPTSPQNTIRGSVSDFSSITKTGGGVALIGAVADVANGLTITADTYNVTGGGLYFNADITGATQPKAIINAGGVAVGGTGVWNADLNLLAGGISAGAIPINLDANPENAVGAVTVTGDVVHSPGSFIRLDIIPDTMISDGINSDVIDQIGVGNTYNVAGGNLRISSTDLNRVITPGRYTIVDSDESILGLAGFGTIGVQFNANTPDTGPFTATGAGANFLGSVLTNHFVAPGLADGGTDLVLDVDYNFAGLPGLTGNQSSFGGALDRLADLAGTGMLGMDEQNLIAALAFSDLATVQASLAGLTPETGLAFAAGTINSNYRLHHLLRNRLAAARANGSPMTMTSDGKSAITPAARGTFWGSFSYDSQDANESDGREGVDGDTMAITAGYDYQLAPNLLLGGMIDGSRGDFDHHGGEGDLDSLRFLAYGTYGASTGFYSDFLLGYGDHDFDQSRSVGGIPGIAGSRKSDTDASSFQAMLTVGHTLGDDTFSHGPFAGLEYQRVSVDGFTDRGGFVNLRVDGSKVESLRGLLGYRVDARHGRFRPYASVAYAHEFEDGPNRTTASFGGMEFRLNGGELQSALLLNAGTSISLSEDLTLDVGYRGEISVEGEGVDSHGGSIGLGYRF